jgi:hypothetical protein
MTSIDEAANAILDLINSRPRTPSKAEIAAILAGMQAPALAPTELGRELLRRIPAHAAAVAKDIAANGLLYAYADVGARDEQVAKDIDAAMEIVDAINAQPVTSLAHAVDCAIVSRFRSLDRDYDHDEVEDHVAAHVAIVRFLLQAAGIPEASCSVSNPAFAT